jgi:1-acyl-sn-glycerol-3-phosphate acyltransferase
MNAPIFGSMKIIPRLYSIYAGLIFAILFIVFIPLLILGAQRLEWHPFALKINHWWAHSWFSLIGMKPRMIYHHRPDPKKRYIICANHFSYLDIPSLGLLPVPFKFIGKSSLENIPLFGYMYQKIHITVNRSSFKSRAESMEKVRKMVDHGFNIAFFPEGGVRTQHPPFMFPFRDGAFRLAVEKQLPILPVTLPNNYKILPDDDQYYLHPLPMELIIHQPIYPEGKDEQAIQKLRNEVFEVIQLELNKQCRV